MSQERVTGVDHPVQDVVVVVGDDPPVAALDGRRPAQVGERGEEKVEEPARPEDDGEPLPLAHLFLVVVPDLDDVSELDAWGRLLARARNQLLVST